MSVTRIHPKIKKLLVQTVHWAVMLAITLLMLMPLAWMLATSMRRANESFKLPPSFFPTVWNITNYTQILRGLPVLQYTLNSLFITSIATFLTVLTVSLAAYAFARIDFKFKNVLFPVLLAGLMIPAQSIIIPIFLIIRGMNLIDNPLSLILISIYYPLGLFMLRQFMMTIPKSYDEAAYCDGASKLTIFFRIILPMSKSAIMVVIVMNFIKVWNDFFNAMIFITSNEKMTLPLGIRMLNTSNGNSNMPIMTAAVVLTLIPPLLIYIFGQKYLIRGTIISGVKS